MRSCHTSADAQAMDYLRAAMAATEYSERALALTETVIELNAAHYTAWHFRRQCLFALKKDLAAELDFIEQVALNTPKNYQIWHHRRAVVEQYGDGSQELLFVNQILQLDAKNYHAWAHRQWALQQFGQWQDELDLLTKLLDDDLRNNSAWNHRLVCESPLCNTSQHC
jgi:protein farnesyltransferase/geranylgeranyltransferase type-1 subunit alpha